MGAQGRHGTCPEQPFLRFLRVGGLGPLQPLAVSVVAAALCPRRRIQQHSALLCGTCGNRSCSDHHCFSAASPSCLGERLYLFWPWSERAISPLLFYLQLAPERADTDAEHPQPALPPRPAGGALPLELLRSRYRACPAALQPATAPAAPQLPRSAPLSGHSLWEAALPTAALRGEGTSAGVHSTGKRGRDCGKHVAPCLLRGAQLDAGLSFFPRTGNASLLSACKLGVSEEL